MFTATSLKRALLAALVVAGVTALPRAAQPPQDAALPAQVDRIAQAVLAATGAPSASVAVVVDGNSLTRTPTALPGSSRDAPPRPDALQHRLDQQTVHRRRACCSSQQEGKIALDDRSAHGSRTDPRERGHRPRDAVQTSGYQDYWPQDYVHAADAEAVTPRRRSSTRWAKIPLDFEPGTKWQYSNTNYVIAGMIVEKIPGEPLLHFLQTAHLRPRSG